jgi:penicillin-binding protein 2
MDPRNGEILGLVSQPNFDPNIFTRRISHAEWRKLNAGGGSIFTNRAIQGEYPPASTFKLVVAIAALEEELISADGAFVCNGTYQVGNRAFRCWKKGGHGQLNIIEGIVHSCDIFFYQLGERVGVERMALYARKLGLGSSTGIDLPEEKHGLTPTPQWKRKKFRVSWYPGDTVNMSIGQGFVLTTPLQMANAYAALANGGTLYRPHLLKGITPEIIRELNLKPLTKKVLREAFTSVVSRGTGYKAKVAGVEVAGKTGTAQNPHGADHAWFIGFAPAQSPSVVVCVILENAGHGSSQAAPLCGKIIKRIMQLK